MMSAGRLGFVVSVLVVSATTGTGLSLVASDVGAAGAEAIVVAAAPAVPPPPVAAPSAPVVLREASPRPDPLQGWAVQQAGLTGIPVPALRAYGRTELRLAVERPGCRLGWTTLAGIGEVESDHGRYAGRVVREDGRPDRPVVGVALDGVGVARVGDTDGGVLDGDARLDRAVGPMQLLPATWRRWRADGDGDGVRDPQDVDDAALAAGRYLCATGPMGSDAGWRAAVLAYNDSSAYLSEVAAWAGAYSRASLGG
ncbi:MAG: murein transglycosylase [Rhodoferax sp.]|nr:murein transglycosylase [Actinomycetota bacterium]